METLRTMTLAPLKFASLALAASALALSFAATAEDTAEAVAPAAEMTLAQAKADPDNWRPVDPENLFIFDTTKGRVLIEAFPEVAPKHYKQFSTIIRSGDYDGTGFHRVIDDFMAQGGDIFALKGRDSGLPDIEGEFTFRRDPATMPLEADDWSGRHGEIRLYQGLPDRDPGELLCGNVGRRHGRKLHPALQGHGVHRPDR
jgi:peptidylprolyl isomerase